MLRSHSLTYDERKAAEAAFRGLPADPRWSERGHAVYEGIMASTKGRDIVEAITNSVADEECASPALAGARS